MKRKDKHCTECVALRATEENLKHQIEQLQQLVRLIVSDEKLLDQHIHIVYN